MQIPPTTPQIMLHLHECRGSFVCELTVHQNVNGAVGLVVSDSDNDTGMAAFALDPADRRALAAALLAGLGDD